MNRDSKGRFCKANKIKSTKIPFLSKGHINKKEDDFEEWSDFGKEIEKALKELDETEPIIFHIKVEEKDRFADCVNNACIFDRLDWDERAKFMANLVDNYEASFCDVMGDTDCTIAKKCSDCFTDWFFNMYTPEVFHKILGD